MTTDLQLMPTAPVAPLAPAMPKCISRYNAKGNRLGTRQCFSGHGTPAELKAFCRDKYPDDSNAQRKARVNTMLRDSKAASAMFAVAWVQSRIDNGGVPTHGDMSKHGDSGALHFVFPPAEAVAKAEVAAPDPELVAANASLVAKQQAMADEIAQLRAQLKLA